MLRVLLSPKAPGTVMMATVLHWESGHKGRLSQIGILELCSPVYDPKVLENPEEWCRPDRNLCVAASWDFQR